MSAGKGNPFWKMGKLGQGLRRRAGESLIEERGGTPAGDRFDPTFPDRDWIGYAQQGGGTVPSAENWRRSPKELQDRAMGDSTKRLR